jgi:hypothetical protein
MFDIFNFEYYDIMDNLKNKNEIKCFSISVLDILNISPIG